MRDQRSSEREKLQELLRQQIILTRFGELALRSDDLDEILTEACHLVGEAMGTDLAKVVELQEDQATLLVRAGVGWKAGVVGVETIRAADDTSEAHALKTHEPMISPDVSTETRFRYPAFLTDHGVKAVVNVVIIGAKDKPPFGILQVDSREPRDFTDEDILFLRSYANLLAAAVDRLSVIGEMREAQARLRESEARLARAISAAGMSTWEWDTVNDTLRFSHGFEALYGREIGTLPSVGAVQRTVHPEDRSPMDVAMDRALQGEDKGDYTAEFRVVLPDRSIRWLRSTGNAEFDTMGAPTRLAGVTQDITSSRDADERIAHMARHDGLTGLLNRRALRERLEDALLRSQRGESCAILALDLNRFKDVNDTLGHAVGDAVLCAVASRLSEATRETDVLARPGGDEFVVIQFGLHHLQDVEILATRIVDTLSQPFEIDGHTIHTGVSIGIAVVPADGTDVEQVLRCADLALYGAKRDDDIRFRFFEPGMQARVQERRQLVADLHLALDRGEFELHYQPLVELVQNRIIGFEALVRWRHPVRGLVPPDAFIPLAEETGLIEPLGKWILFKACNDAIAWPPDIKVAVNLSVVQFAKGDLPGTVAAALAGAGLMPRRLELEITESLLLHENEATLATLRKLREHGVSISMDDFGIGYSSLSYIAKFPFDKVKIDRSFVAAASSQRRGGAAIIRAVAELCGSLGITTTAEGIETLDQLQQVVSLGCSEGQGYFFAPPRPLADIAALFNSWSQSDHSMH
ncbi:EAL domain-containing protein [Lichenicola cladoniae]|uniref:EAL domain-containing protein n=1 Tax=Lichenicola cladoniae TaxID=1484109 RepID=A0A6M8H8E2_9PROT|nr:EAL domain-containing protein [Lichenicola cladoniae]NPD65287.1 EAL domain-containing protein [Acetobacteraceae bacterium]QKE88873.1 EAL domain-containing protein [Lichenicola cladoniae]